MFVLPVIDLLQGVVVRGVAGQRESYRPIQSRICTSADPVEIAQAFRDRFGLDRLYIADLDAILHQRPNFDTYRRLAAGGFKLLIDSGIRDLGAARAVLDAGAESIIAGLESLPAPELLGELVSACGPQRVVFSLDMKRGQPLIGGSGWHTESPVEISEIAFRQGIQRLIVLDLAQVGGNAGISTLELCRNIRTLAPTVELITGGGIRGPADLHLMAGSPVDGVLIASALHDGLIGRDDVVRFAKP